MDILGNPIDLATFCAIFDSALKCKGDCNIHCPLYAAVRVQGECNDRGLTMRDAFRRWVQSSLSKEERKRVWDGVLGGVK